MTPEALKERVRTVRDWPVPGVNFRDITTVLEDAEGYRAVIDWMGDLARACGAQAIAGVDARGFVFAGALGYTLSLPILLIRKKGKLPYKTLSEDYALEYGSATIEIHEGSVPSGAPVLVVDDLVATGGTLLAAERLLKRCGSGAVTVAAMVDLPELGGSAALRDSGIDTHAFCRFSEAE